MVTSQVLAYFPKDKDSAGQSEGWRSMAKGTQRLGYTLLRSEFYLFAVPEKAHPGSRADGSQGNSVLDVFPGTAALWRRKGITVDSFERLTLRDELDVKAGFYNLFSLQKDALSCEGDLLGHKSLYWSEVDHGVLMASHLRDLFRIAPELIKPLDEQALYGVFKLRFPLADRTLHERVKRVPAQSKLVWDFRSGMRILKGRTIDVSKSRHSVSARSAIDRIVSALEAGIRRRLEWNGTRIRRLPGDFC